MKVLITGAAGRIGAHLTRSALEAGHEVRAFVVPGDPRAELIRLPGVELIEGDLRDREALHRIATGVDAIFHLAGALTSRGNTDREFIELNLNATFDLLLAARAGSPNLQRFAYASSDAVYAAGGPAASLPIDESSPVQPGSIYGATKAGAEQLCLSFWRSEGFPATILRFGATCDAHELIDPKSVFARWLYLREAREFLAAQSHRTPAQDETLRILSSLDTGSDKLIALTDMTIHPEVRQWGDARDVADGCLLHAGQSGCRWRNLRPGRRSSLHHPRAGDFSFPAYRDADGDRARADRAAALVSQQRAGNICARLRAALDLHHGRRGTRLATIGVVQDLRARWRTQTGASGRSSGSRITIAESMAARSSGVFGAATERRSS